MPKNYTILEQLKENITLSGANTYTEVELVLLEEIGKRNKKGDKVKVMMVHGIALELVSGQAIFDGAGVDAGDDWSIQFTTNN